MAGAGQADSLPEKLYLLACDVDRSRLRSSPELGVLLRGAAVAELNLRGLLTEDETSGGKVRASSNKRADDPLLDSVLTEVAEARPRSWSAWIRRGRRHSACATRRNLEAKGVIEVETRRPLGIFVSRRVTVVDPGSVAALRERVRTVLTGSAPVAEIDPADAALVALVGAGQFRMGVSRREFRQRSRRVEELAQRGGAAVPALKTVVRRARAARIAAASASGG
ncbi:MAG TPA: GPP34 family phosphoprotein [Pseudonocardiaceae bacterium]|nr:GPP34 family phosphoprotein [Pseudonocardiaceae bacterium]